MASDAVSCILAAWVSFSLRLGQLPWLNTGFFVFLVSASLLAIGIFRFRGVYNALFRFHGPHGLAQIARSCLLLSIPLIVIFGLFSIDGVPRTVSVIFPAFLFMFVAVSRIVARFVLLEMVQAKEQSQRVFIYGAGMAGRKLAASLQHEARYHLVAFCDDDTSLQGRKLEGTPILSSAEMIDALNNKEADLVLISLTNLGRTKRAALIKQLQATGAHVQTLPSFHSIVAGEVSISDLRDIEVTDLLARSPVVADTTLLGEAITGKVVLVTGAGGSIGSELCRQILLQRPRHLILFEMTEAALYAIHIELRRLAAERNLDCIVTPYLGTLGDIAVVNRLFRTLRPQTVYHAAAYKHVPLVEANIAVGIQNNVFGTLHCTQAAIAEKVERFILVSTDKAVRPTSVMGASKRVCELILQAMADRESVAEGPIFSMVRFGNVLGSSGSVVPLFQQQIAQGGPITLTHRDVTRFFMTIPEAAELVIQAGALANGGEVYLLDMGKPVRIFDLAQSMIELSGHTVRNAANPEGDIEIVEVGLRDGEKLFEELLIGSEALKTPHPRIFHAREEKIDWPVLERKLFKIQIAIETNDIAALCAILSDLVAGYQAVGTRNESSSSPQTGSDSGIIRHAASTPVGATPLAAIPNHQL